MVETLNDNETFSIEKSNEINDNVNEDTFVVGNSLKEKLAYQTACKLADKFNNSKGLRFYYMVALKLSEHQIWFNYDLANRKGITQPSHYFTRVCNNQLKAASGS